MADGILKVGKIQTSSGSGTITIGQSGETISIPSGATQTNIGGNNTPAFGAYQSSNQSISNNTETIITLDTELYDTDNAFYSNTFTVPSNKSGKYFIYAQAGK